MNAGTNAYLRWNDGLVRHFFNADNAQKSVFLYVTDETVAELGAPFGDGVADFIRAVQRVGAPWVRPGELCEMAVETYAGWRGRQFEYPPYVAYLALFVLAVGTEGDFRSHAYYPRLRTLLGRVGSGPLPDFDSMGDLWRDLQEWSIADKRGELGIFEARLAGKWVHVGLPIAQKLLTDTERRSLPDLFAAAGLDPADQPNDDVLQRALVLHSDGRLRSRTLGLLERNDDATLRQFLLQAIRDELGAWDGSTADAVSPDASHQFAALRLALRFDPTAGTVSTGLRCRLPADFPESGVEIDLGMNGRAHCSQDVPGWSAPIQLEPSGELFPATHLDWSTGATFVDSTGSWTFSLAKSDVRVLVDGRSYGVAGLIETRSLPRSAPFFLVFKELHWPALKAWCQTQCVGFERVDVTGLRPQWRFARCREALTDVGVRDSFPALAFSKSARMRLVGGIRDMGQTMFFSFAPPSVAIDGTTGTETLTANGRQMEADVKGLFSIPASVEGASRVDFELFRDGTSVRSQSIFLSADFDWKARVTAVWSDRWGAVAEDHAIDRVSGALVLTTQPRIAYMPSPFLLPELRSLTGRDVYFIGRRPGEISLWPSQSLPVWQPVWAVRKTKGKAALFCATDILSATPKPEPVGSIEARTLWKRVLWSDRHKRKPPTDPKLGPIWSAYVEGARVA